MCGPGRGGREDAGQGGPQRPVLSLRPSLASTHPHLEQVTPLGAARTESSVPFTEKLLRAAPLPHAALWPDSPRSPSSGTHSRGGVPGKHVKENCPPDPCGGLLGGRTPARRLGRSRVSASRGRQLLLPGSPHVTSPHQFTFQHQIHLSRFTTVPYTSTTLGLQEKSR